MQQLTTVFAEPIDDDRLDNLTMWLDQGQFDPHAEFDDVECRFSCSLARRTITARVAGTSSQERLSLLCSRIDEALSRIVADLGPRTTRSRPPDIVEKRSLWRR